LDTVAVNWWVFPTSSCTVVGEIVIATGRMIVTTAVADFEESATDVAVTDT
jgi:predicted RNase H-like nuclease